MASENAKAVAKEVIARVRKGQLVNKGEIIRNHGYSATVAKRPSKVTDTKAYKEVMDPVVDGLRRFQRKLVEEFNSPTRLKSLKREKLIFMSNTLKNTTHDIQLLTGGKTESTGIEELADSINELIKNVSE